MDLISVELILELDLHRILLVGFSWWSSYKEQDFL